MPKKVHGPERGQQRLTGFLPPSRRQPLAEVGGNQRPKGVAREPEEEEEAVVKTEVVEVVRRKIERQRRAPQPRTGPYQRRSSDANAIREDPIQAYNLFFRHLYPGHVDWNHVLPGDQRLEKKYSRLSVSQRQIYFILLRLLQSYVLQHIGADSFDDCSRQWRWNWPTWHSVIFKLVESVKDTVRGENGCWFSSLSTDLGGRPKLPIRPGQIERRPDGNHSRRNVFDYYRAADQSRTLETTAARTMAVLRLGVPPDPRLQASHLCHNFPQTCVNPRHVVWESDCINKSRNLCVMGNVVSCFHRAEKCIFTDVDGHWLPHRNQDFRSIPCDCTVDCLEALTVRVQLDE